MKTLKGWQKYALAIWFMILGLFVWISLTQRYPIDWT
jgi:hypothetical protein